MASSKSPPKPAAQTARTKPAVHGWLILDKPVGLGSTQAVGAAKRLLREAGHAKGKVGHGGTLDPLAQGVLPIALGEATKLAGRMLDASKIYEFTVRFGAETSTLDAEGEIVASCDELPSMAEIEALLQQFIGSIEQVPPAFSALKVDGERAYDLARAGREVALKRRSVTIHELIVLSARGPAGEDVTDLAARLGEVTLSAHVSKGTYIRSLARDLARAADSLGSVTYLNRTKAGPFTAAQAISLDNLNNLANGGALIDHILPLKAGLDDIPALNLDQTSAQAVRQGRVLSDMPQSSGLYCAMLDANPVALVEVLDGTAKVVRGFNLPDVAE